MIGKATNFAPAVTVKLAEKIIESPVRSVAQALTKRSYMSMSKMLQNPQSQDEEHFIVAVVLAVMNEITNRDNEDLGLSEDNINLILDLISQARAGGKNTLQNVKAGLIRIHGIEGGSNFNRLFAETSRHLNPDKVRSFLLTINDDNALRIYIRSLMTNPRGLGRKTIEMISLQINRHLSPYSFLKSFRGERSDLYGGAQPKIKTRRVLHRSNHLTRSFR